MDDELRAGLRESYGRKARERDLRPVQPWKARERLRFLALLQSEGARTLLELGSGPGKDGEFFRDQGLDVTCTDLSPEMVALCESKGLAARVMDLSDLDFPPETFDAVYALNCLLHLPGRELPAALGGIRTTLKPGGLFYLGVYGGRDHEGVWADDPYEPKRFFSFHTDERLREIVAGPFDVRSFRRTALAAEQARGLHFQSLILRKRQSGN
ncbi:MAG: class I SAM-dependent methyltransferase [Rubrobacter sp.]